MLVMKNLNFKSMLIKVKLKKLYSVKIKKVGQAFLAEAVKAGIQFLTVILFSKLMSIESFGKLSYYSSFQVIFSSFIIFGTTGIFNSRAVGRNEDSLRYFASSLWVSVINWTIMSLIILFLSWIGSSPFDLAPSQLLVILFSTLGYVLFAQFSNYYIMRKYLNNYFVVMSCYHAISLGLGLIIFQTFWSSWLSYFLGQCGSLILLIAYARQKIFKCFELRWPDLFIKVFYKDGLKLLPYALSIWVMSSSDRFFLDEMQGDRSVGIYSFAYQFSLIVVIVTQVLNKLHLPSFFSMLSKKNWPTKPLARLFSLVILLFIFCACYLLVLRLCEPLFNNYTKYGESTQLLPVLVISSFFLGIQIIFSNVLLFYKKYNLLSSVVVLSGLCNIILNYFFIREYGTFGAALSTAISYFISSLVICLCGIGLIVPIKRGHSSLEGLC